jgi:hypothetical protein
MVGQLAVMYSYYLLPIWLKCYRAEKLEGTLGACGFLEGSWSFLRGPLAYPYTILSCDQFQRLLLAVYQRITLHIAVKAGPGRFP